MNTEFISKKTAGLLIKILGIIQLAIGLFSLGIAPLEIYSYYLISEGGIFYYDGFKIGSFLYGLIFAQIIGYYFIAFIFITIGYGHLKLKVWALKLSKSCIWFWIIAGLPIMICFLPLLSMKEIDVQYPIFCAASVIILFIAIIPGLLLSFYNQNNVKKLFENSNHSEAVIRNIPIKGYLLLLVYILYIMIFHIMLFYKGIFPFFGTLLINFKGLLLYDLCILIMFLLIYGLFKRKYWTWILSITFFVLMSISTITTLINYQYVSIIELLNFPKLEKDIFMRLPLKSSYILIAIVGILLFTIILIIKIKNYYIKEQKLTILKD